MHASSTAPPGLAPGSAREAPSPAVAPAVPVDRDVARTLRLGGRPRLWRLVRRGLLVVAAAGLAAIGFRWWQARGQAPPRAYLTAPLERGELTVTVTATGTLEARNLVAISSEVSGRIERVLVDANHRVTAGQVLAEIDQEPFTAQVEQAAAQLAQARAQLAQARATRREALQTRSRTEGLVGVGVATEQERDVAVAAAERAQAAVTLAEASVAQARAALRLARTSLARTTLRAPIDGVVLVREVEAGQTVVAAFQSPVLFQIAGDLRAMRASVDVDEADVGAIREGQAATFTVAAYLDRRFDARVGTVHNAARTVDRVVTYEAELDVDNPDLALRPGMTVTAAIVTRRVPDALLVASPALRFTPPEESASAHDRIWVLRDGRPTPIEVSILAHDDTLTAIAAPALAPGDVAIVNLR